MESARGCLEYIKIKCLLELQINSLPTLTLKTCLKNLRIKRNY